MKIALIVNPNSGRKRAGKLLPRLEEKLLSQKIEQDTFISKYHGHLFKLTSRLDITTYDAVVSMGGDGTNYQVLNALLSQFKPEDIPALGIIPVGSGNSFAKDINIHTFDDGLNAIVNHQPRPVDVCSFTQDENKHYFVNLMGLGFVTDVAKTADKLKYFKDFSYVLGVLYRMVTLKFAHIELEVDGEKITGDNCFVEFCNSRYTGGNMMMAPQAKIDDGLMDIIVAGRLSRTSLLRTLPKIFKGTHLENPAVTHFQAKKAKIKTWPVKTLLPDGEIFGITPATIRVHPKLVEYL